MKIDALLDYPAILACHARPVHFAVRLRADPTGNPRPRPAAFCVVIDRSGSMSGPPLARAKAAAALAVKNLRSRDHFALVVFDDTAQTVIPLQAPTNKAALLARISRINEGGSTNLSAGWMLGRDELRQSPAGASRRLLLLSDGQLNVGITDPPAVRQIVAAGLEQDTVRTSCLGFGDGYNEELMADLARATNGAFYDAESPEKLPAIFAAELDRLQRLAVQNLRLRIKPLAYCEALAPLGEYPQVELPDGRVEFALGDLVAEEERIACFAVQVLALPTINGQPVFKLDGEPLLDVEVVYDGLDAQGVASREYRQRINIQAAQDPGKMRLNGEVVPWVALQRASKAVSEATREMDAGRAPAAAVLLKQAIEDLRHYGEAQGVAEALRLLEETLVKIDLGEWSARERKAVCYEAQSLRRMSSAEMWTAAAPPPSFKKPRSGAKSRTKSAG
jgi:Ca-activated chloride channel family protein